MENTGGDVSWIGGNNEQHNRRIHNIVREGIIEINQHENKWSCAVETSAEVHKCKLHSVLDNNSPHFVWYY